jgi:cytochrome b
VRLFHWSLVLGIGVAALTGFILGPSWISLHIISATLATALIGLRLVWGFLGPTFARFSSFVVLRPSVLRDYMTQLADNRAPRYIGHNPLGGVMVMVLIAIILALAVTGTMELGGVLKTGPLAGYLSYDFGYITAVLHTLIAYGLILLVLLHWLGVWLESRRERENLVAAMVTGHKASRPGDVRAPVRRAHGVAAVVISVLLLGGSFYGLQRMSLRPPTALPIDPARFDPVFADECSACHMLYHPSLLPAADWKTLMAGLDDHYGEDASLDADTARQIRDWLMANAAETADTRPAHLFTLPRHADGTLGSVAATAAWHSLHDDALESGAFDVKSVRSRANCKACHSDAETGFFSPFNVNIPKE